MNRIISEDKLDSIDDWSTYTCPETGEQGEYLNEQVKALKDTCKMLYQERKGLTAALKSVVPFFAEDMPDGPKSEKCCASNEYREAYRLVLEALKDAEE